ncbi:HAD family hydrolase [Mesorhizobium sp. CAU 1732]|uniref:HAD family hydrolase n=1 Tax=Mesorhizobium sp. CAU 1732 TaxID=3140358 RepID=UPI0032608121
MLKPIIVFDLDGTLVDTAPDLLTSLNHCLTLAGMTPAEPGELRGFVGMGGRVMIERAFAAQQRALSAEQLDTLQVSFLDHYGSHMPGESRPYPGALDAVARFASAGYDAAICTNKYEGMATSLIAALGLADRFSAICGGDSFAFRKPDPRHLTETIARAGGDPERAVMIGDSRTDIDTAKAAGIPVIAVDFGYTDRHVREFEPSRIISHFDELTVEMAEALLGETTR